MGLFSYFTQKKAAEKGNPQAQVYIGDLYYNGKIVSKSYEKAMEWYIKAAEQNSAEAQFNIGVCYSEGKGVEKNLKKSVEWYTKAAEQNFAEAQYALGGCFARGEGVEQNQETAFKWFTKAAEQNNAAAQCTLGVCYYEGDGVEKNYFKAVEWYTKSANQGEILAQIELARCYAYMQGIKYEKGDTGSTLLNKSIQWLNKAGIDTFYEQALIYLQFAKDYTNDNAGGIPLLINIYKFAALQIYAIILVPPNEAFIYSKYVKDFFYDIRKDLEQKLKTRQLKPLDVADVELYIKDGAVSIMSINPKEFHFLEPYTKVENFISHNYMNNLSSQK